MLPELTVLSVVAIFASGVAAGTINAVVGSGTLITFPILLALGYPPLTANISNNIGLIPGGVTGSWGYRRELDSMRETLRLLLPWSIGGSLAGALLLLLLPASTFDAVVPVLVTLAVVLVLVQPLLQEAIRRRSEPSERSEPRETEQAEHGGWPARLTAFGCAIYGGYFGAAQGVLLMGLLPLVLSADLQRLNGAKNVLTAAVNVIAAVLFVVLAFDRINWWVVLIIAAGSMLGGSLGARLGRRLHPTLLRVVIASVGMVAVVRLLTT
jgi:uncharacterized membrane protein YfcA